MINPALPEFIEPYRLADREITLEGTFDSAKLPRFMSAVDSAGQMQVKAEFARYPEGHRLVSGNVLIAVRVICERCLQPMDYDLDADFLLVLVAEEAQLDSSPKQYEPWLVAPGGEVPITELLEDTVLLALPQFPMHPPSECRIQTSFGTDAVTEETADDTEKPNPFSVLADLKSGRKK